jgi:hypothetical protein
MALSSSFLLATLVLLSCGKDKETDPPNNDTGPANPPADPCTRYDLSTAEPGAPVLHRLTKAEIENSLFDLLGIRSPVGDHLIENDYFQGYPTLGEAQSTTDTHIDALLAAFELVELELGADFNEQVTGLELGESQGFNPLGYADGQDWIIDRVGVIGYSIEPHASGRYTVRVEASVAEPSNDPPRLVLGLMSAGLTTNASDFKPIQFTYIDLDQNPQEYEIDLDMRVGRQRVYLGWDKPDQDKTGGIRLANLEIDGTQAFRSVQSDMLDCLAQNEPMVCIEAMPLEFAKHAWRRPLSTEEESRLADLWQDQVDAGLEIQEAFALVVRAVLMSPQFLYLVEEDAGVTRALTGWEIASRLSYFLWDTLPDDALFALAESGDLLEDPVLREQVSRMLQDERSWQFVDDYLLSWMALSGLNYPIPDPVVFPELTPSLLESMREESARFFHANLIEDRPLGELLTGQETFLDSALAHHYGLTPPEEDWGAVSLAGTGRTGLLTHGSLLTAFSKPNQSNPVTRGQWVARRVLCRPPGPVPDDVEGFRGEEAGEGVDKREAMAMHRSDPYCASCHELMDPIGLSLEGFDAIGRSRTVDEWGNPVDTTGEIPGATSEDTPVSFEGPVDLAEHIAQTRTFAECMGENLFFYSVARSMKSLEYCGIREVAEANTDQTLSGLIAELVTSPYFQQRSSQEDVR